MRRLLIGCAMLALFPRVVQAEQIVTSTETIVRLNVQPMPAPKPALRYLLLPELKEQQPGNPIPNYLRALLDQDFTADRETIGRSALRLADRAARMDKPDWQILLKVKTDGRRECGSLCNRSRVAGSSCANPRRRSLSGTSRYLHKRSRY